MSDAEERIILELKRLTAMQGPTGPTGPAGPTGPTGPGTGDVSSNTATSVIDELPLFADTSGKLLKRATLTGVLRADSGVISADTDVTDLIIAASDTAAGKVELATTAETATGTDATRAVTPDGLHDMTSLAGAAWFLDEDAMTSNSDVKVPSQQSVKAYVDANAGGGSFWLHFMAQAFSTVPAWTNMPAAQTLIPITMGIGERLVDLTGMTELLFAIRTGSSGTFTAGNFLDIQYSTNIATPSWADFNLDLDFGTSTDAWSNTGWVSIPVGARGLVLLRLVGEGGNGTNDPSFSVMSAQLRA